MKLAWFTSKLGNLLFLIFLVKVKILCSKYCMLMGYKYINLMHAWLKKRVKNINFLESKMTFKYYKYKTLIFEINIIYNKLK